MERSRLPVRVVVLVAVLGVVASCAVRGSTTSSPGTTSPGPPPPSAVESDEEIAEPEVEGVEPEVGIAEPEVERVEVDDTELTSFTYFPLEQIQPADADAGFSMYVAAWPFQQTYPGADYQTGLPSTWLRPANLEDDPRGVYSTIEGGLGWWRDTRFATEVPKFIMGGVSLDFFEWANGPGAGAGSAGFDERDWDEPQGKYGIAQLSPYVLWAPDGLNLAPGTNGELFGYGYHPLPIIDEQTSSLGEQVETGDRSWTLFLDSANFRGPVSFFIPNFFTKPAIGDPSLAGIFFDASGSDWGRAIGLETQTIPAVQATVDGVTYARITRMQYPATDDESSVILHRVTSYGDEALRDAAEAWFAGGPAPSGELDPDDSHLSPFFEAGAGDDVFMTFVDPDAEAAEEYMVDFGALGEVDVSDQSTFRYVWNLDLVEREGDSFVLPEYFRLDGEEWQPIRASEVPESSGLQIHVFDELGQRQDDEPYTTPDDPDGPWRSPGPSSETFTADLGDGSTVTYAWYRFVDQPAMRYWEFSDDELDVIQARVEAIHREWTPERSYLSGPDVGELASLDPAVVVEPPPGFEVGYVPIVLRQELTR
ncbi:MAG: hypothetical protein AAGA99_18930 [Actinomycetota bacterium]